MSDAPLWTSEPFPEACDDFYWMHGDGYDYDITVVCASKARAGELLEDGWQRSVKPCPSPESLAALEARAERAERERDEARLDYDLLRGQTTRELDAKDVELDEMRTRLVEEHEGNSGHVSAVSWEEQCHDAEQEQIVAIENVRALRAERERLAEALRVARTVLGEAREMLGVFEDNGGHDGLRGEGYRAVLDHIDECKATAKALLSAPVRGEREEGTEEKDANQS